MLVAINVVDNSLGVEIFAGIMFQVERVFRQSRVFETCITRENQSEVRKSKKIPTTTLPTKPHCHSQSADLPGKLNIDTLFSWSNCMTTCSSCFAFSWILGRCADLCGCLPHRVKRVLVNRVCVRARVSHRCGWIRKGVQCLCM